MKGKQLGILLVLVVVLGGLGIIVHNHESNTDRGGNASMGQKLLGNNFPLNDVAHIGIKQASNECNLVKKDNLWCVSERGNYPANYSEIAEFLLKAQDIKITQSETVGPSQLPRLALVSGQGTNSALTLEFKDKSDKPIKTLLLGKKHMKKSDRPSPYGDMGEEGYPDGRYVKVGDSDNVAVISDALANIEPKPENWLNKDFFKVEKVRSIAVDFPVATNSWKISRESETGEWKLADAKPNEQLDSSKTSSLSNPLSSPSFQDVAVGAKPEALGLDKPTTVTLDTFENFTYNIKVGQKTNDNYPLMLTVAAQIPKERTAGKDEKAEDKAKLDKEFQDKNKKLQEKLDQEKAYEKWTYLVSTWTLDSVLKERSQLMAEKKEEPKKDDNKADASTNATTTADAKVIAPENIPPGPPAPAEASPKK